MLVYQAGKTSRLHFDAGCEQIRRSSSFAKYTFRPVELSSLGELLSPRFCTCCAPPELARVRTVHRVCFECKRKRPYPCRHNGGVPVVRIEHYHRLGKPVRRVRVLYRWPENLIGAILADTEGGLAGAGG